MLKNCLVEIFQWTASSVPVLVGLSIFVAIFVAVSNVADNGIQIRRFLSSAACIDDSVSEKEKPDSSSLTFASSSIMTHINMYSR